MRVERIFVFAIVFIVFGLSPVSGGPSSQIAKVYSDEGSNRARFGLSVGISNGVAIVGDPRADENGVEAGAAYLFDTTTGKKLHKLLADDGVAADFFGVNVSICDDIAVVGATGVDSRFSDTGAVYVFDVNSGEQLRKLIPASARPGDGVGQAVSVHNGTVAVGSPGDDNNGSNSGTVYLFDAMTGDHTGTFRPSDGGTQDSFGFFVAVGDEYLVASSPGAQLAYSFDLTTGRQRKYRSTAVFLTSYGNAVAVEGSTVLVGDQRDGVGIPSTGAVYIYDATTGLLRHRVKLDRFMSEFGTSIDISGGVAVVGSHNDFVGEDRPGVVYLIDAMSGLQLGRRVAADGQGGDWFGAAVGIDGGTIVVGAPYDDDLGNDSGSAYILDTRMCKDADFNADGVVDTADLGLLIGVYGSSGQAGSVAGDINGDEVVDVADLGQLIGAFGTMCF